MWGCENPPRRGDAALESARRVSLGLLALTVWSLTASWGYAEIVVFSSGRAMSVASVRVDGDLLVVRLRRGGEIVCPRSLIQRIEPDEVPYDDDALASSADRAPTDDVDALIEAAAAAHGLDARLVRAVVQVESAFVAQARSPKGAMGLMQLMPETARQYGLEDPFDPRANLDAGVRHLRRLLDRFTDLRLALAAYNAGEDAVRRAGGVPPWPETLAYVARVLKLVDGR